MEDFKLYAWTNGTCKSNEDVRPCYCCSELLTYSQAVCTKVSFVDFLEHTPKNYKICCEQCARSRGKCNLAFYRTSLFDAKRRLKNLNLSPKDLNSLARTRIQNTKSEVNSSANSSVNSSVSSFGSSIDSIRSSRISYQLIETFVIFGIPWIITTIHWMKNRS